MYSIIWVTIKWSLCFAPSCRLPFCSCPSPVFMIAECEGSNWATREICSSRYEHIPKWRPITNGHIFWFKLSSKNKIFSFCSHFAICVIGNPPATGSWGIPTIFGNEKAANGNVLNRGHSEPVQGASEPSIANIQLREVRLLYLETGRILEMEGQPSGYHCRSKMWGRFCKIVMMWLLLTRTG